MVVGNPVTVSCFPDCQGFVELRKAFERKTPGIHVKSRGEVSSLADLLVKQYDVGGAEP